MPLQISLSMKCSAALIYWAYIWMLWGGSSIVKTSFQCITIITFGIWLFKFERRWGFKCRWKCWLRTTETWALIIGGGLPITLQCFKWIFLGFSLFMTSFVLLKLPFTIKCLITLQTEIFVTLEGLWSRTGMRWGIFGSTCTSTSHLKHYTDNHGSLKRVRAAEQWVSTSPPNGWQLSHTGSKQECCLMCSTRASLQSNFAVQ